ncbi:hypothetical protein GCM10023318_57030 [Nocardia callitridis]|uniref:Uncharacterized protein n=1 Tax=Nocardia callitridis TaxID=648753 RepID=A0ABP9KXU4_9NOCA
MDPDFAEGASGTPSAPRARTQTRDEIRPTSHPGGYGADRPVRGGNESGQLPRFSATLAP